MTLMNELKDYINGDRTGELIAVAFRENPSLSIHWQVFDEVAVPVAVIGTICVEDVGPLDRSEQLQALAEHELLFCIPMENLSGIDIVKTRVTRSKEVNEMLTMQAEARRQAKEADELRNRPEF